MVWGLTGYLGDGHGGIGSNERGEGLSVGDTQLGLVEVEYEVFVVGEKGVSVRSTEAVVSYSMRKT